jgi:hypothetical protein
LADTIRRYPSASVPSILILIGSKTLTFLFFVFLQIDSWVDILSKANEREQWVQSWSPGGGGPLGRGVLGVDFPWGDFVWGEGVFGGGVCFVVVFGGEYCGDLRFLSFVPSCCSLCSILYSSEYFVPRGLSFPLTSLAEFDEDDEEFRESLDRGDVEFDVGILALFSDWVRLVATVDGDWLIGDLASVEAWDWPRSGEVGVVLEIGVVLGVAKGKGVDFDEVRPSGDGVFATGLEMLGPVTPPGIATVALGALNAPPMGSSG